MEKNYNIDDIENFLNQEMDATELAKFEKEMAEDTDLAAEVDFHADVIKGIQNADPMNFRNMVAGVHQEMKKEGFFFEEMTDETTQETAKPEAKIRRISFGRSLAIAASFALLLLAGWWVFSQPPTPEQLFADNFSIHQDVLSDKIEDRLAETGFGTNKEALNSLQSAINTYNSGDYTNAINQFNTFQNTAPEDALATYAQFYEAIALLKTGKGIEAETKLVSLANNTAFPLQNDAKWYLALAYLQEGKIVNAKSLLQDLNAVDVYKDKAMKLLKNL